MIKGSKHTEEVKFKIRIARKKQIPGMLGKYHSKETKQKISLTKKGKKLSKEHIQKISLALKGNKNGLNYKHSKNAKLKIGLAHKGSKSYLWKGGKSFEPYSIDWTETLKRSIRERDHYICQLCNKQQGDESHSVHHIDYNKKNCNPENLITLCRNCNCKVNHNREYWSYYFHLRQKSQDNGFKTSDFKSDGKEGV